MHNLKMNRRQLLAGLASAGVAGALSPLLFAAQAHHDSEAAPAMSPDQALERLMAGNERFAAGKPTREHQDASRRTQLAGGQAPFAIVVGCSDSRVSPAIVFDQGLGDLFVVRVAGNVIDPSVAGSVEYAVQHLHASLILVLGHEKCGAVTAALLPQADREKESANIQALLNEIEPSLTDIHSDLAADQRLMAAIEANARASARNLAASPVLSAAIAEKKLKIVSGVYHLATGDVVLLQNT